MKNSLSIHESVHVQGNATALPTTVPRDEQTESQLHATNHNDSQRKFARKQHGSTLIELIVVIGVIALIILGVAKNANTATNSNTIRDEISNLATLSSTIKNMFSSQGNYEGLANSIVLQSSTFPEGMRVDADDTENIKTTWASDGVQVASTNMLGSDNDGFTITYSNVPQKQCHDFIAATFRYYYINTAGGAWSQDDDRITSVEEIDTDICTEETGNTIVFTNR